MALPISLEAALRRSCALLQLAEMRAARLVPGDQVVDGRSRLLRRPLPLHQRLDEAFGFSRIHLMSSMGKGFHTNRAIRNIFSAARRDEPLAELQHRTEKGNRFSDESEAGVTAVLPQLLRPGRASQRPDSRFVQD